MPLFDTILRSATAAGSTVLPISESAHRALAALWLGPAPDGDAVRAVAALGTALGLAAALRERGLPCLRAALGMLRPSTRALHVEGGRDLTVIAIAATVSVALDLALAGKALSLAGEPLVVGVGLGATVVLLLSTRAAPPPRLLRPGLLGAILVGLAHGLGAVPGCSPVGGAFVALSWLGVRGWRAAELALLVSLPTLLVTVVRGLGAVRALPRADVGLGVVVAALLAVATALLWRALAERDRTRLVVFWLAPLAIAFLGYAYAIAG